MMEFLHWVVDVVKSFGYTGIFIMTFLEGSFLPIPAEITMIPAGYLVSKGEMNFWLVMISSTAGTIGGAMVNYMIARKYGLPLFIKYGKYFFLTKKKIVKMQRFFDEHGEISTLTGRLLPGLRHFISFPAGVARMRIDKFCFYTGVGGAGWMLALLAVGYFIGDNEEHIDKLMPYVVGGAILIAILAVALYIFWFIRNNKGKPRRIFIRRRRREKIKKD